jgi:hypothetical protein
VLEINFVKSNKIRLVFSSCIFLLPKLFIVLVNIVKLVRVSFYRCLLPELNEPGLVLLSLFFLSCCDSPWCGICSSWASRRDTDCGDSSSVSELSLVAWLLWWLCISKMSGDVGRTAIKCNMALMPVLCVEWALGYSCVRSFAGETCHPPTMKYSALWCLCADCWWSDVWNAEVHYLWC